MLLIDGWAKGQGRRLLHAVTTACLFVLLVPSLAFAYHTDARETRGGTTTYVCTDCHVTWSGGTDPLSVTGDPGQPGWATAGAGPHGYYRTDTAKCRMCHSVHKAPAASIMLLPAATIQATCFSCHDNTGATGVYSALAARGRSVVSSHSIDTTTHVPGGSYDLTAKLGCTSCHSVHRGTSIAPFRSDRALTITGDGGGAKFTNQLLRDDVGGKPRGYFTVYGADWCAGCHDQRHSQSSVVNHPVESSATAGFFHYGRVATVDSLTALTTSIEGATLAGAGLGMTNRGYVMPYPRTTQQGSHKPICQQCHEDARNVGSAGAVVPYKSWSSSDPQLDGPTSSDATNPVFYSFPHQSTNDNLLLEQNDNLCLNCHPVTQLP